MNALRLRVFTRAPIALACSLAFAPALQAQTTLPPLSSDTARLAFSGPLEPARSAAAAEQVASIEIEADRDGVPASGRDSVLLTIRVLDRQGQPVRGELPLVLDTTRGRFVGVDAQDALDAAVDSGFAEPGAQQVARDGLLRLRLQAPSEPGDAQLRVFAGGREATRTVSFVPDLRELIAVGLVEGVINLSRGRGNLLETARPSDGFEQSLRGWSREFDDGRGAYGGRLAFFLKGRVSGQTLLTAAYDSDKDVRERLFRDLQPEAYYPVYGDASEKGFDAASSGRLYVRLDNGRSYLLWGDFTTTAETTNEASRLGRYSRALTGAQGRLQFGGERGDQVELKGFASQDSLRQVVDELPARGISGPYPLRYSGGVAGSERVELLVRDRNAPTVVLSTTPLLRFVDYDFEPFSGRLLFKAPVPSLDANLNPVSIRVVYEVEDGGPNYWVYGGEASVRLGEAARVGATHAKDENPLASYSLSGLNASIKLGAATTAVVEYARSEGGAVTNFGFTPTLGAGTITADAREGQAARVEVRHDGEALQARLYGQRTGAGFENPGAGATLGSGGARTDAGGKATYAVSDTVRVTGEALSSRDHRTDGSRDGAYAGAAWDLAPTVTAELGLRHSRQAGAGATIPATGAAGSLPGTSLSPTTGGTLLDPTALVSIGNTPYESTSAKAKLTWRTSPASSVFVEGEQAVEDNAAGDKGHALAVGGEYRFADLGRLYGRSEWASGLGGDYGLAGDGRQAATVVGIDTPYMKDGQLFSEYRLRDGLAGRDAVAATGLRNSWRVAEGWRMNSAVERVKVLDGSAQAGKAIALGLDYLGSPLWKGSTRLEWRRDDATASVADSTSWLHSVAVARKLDEDWTLLGRNLYLRRDAAQAGADSTENRFQVGAAWRQTRTNEWTALGRYEYWLRDVPAAGEDSRKHIIATDATWHPSRPWWVMGKVAGKWTQARLGCIADAATGARSDCVSAGSNAQWLQGRVIHDLTPTWDVGVMAGLLGESGWRNRRQAFGVELGHLLADNLWLSVGYNRKGVTDKDLATDSAAQGVYLKLRFKFDENLLSRGQAGLDRSVTPGAQP